MGGVRNMLLSSFVGIAASLPVYSQAAQGLRTFSATFGAAPSVGDILVAYGAVIDTSSTGGTPPQSPPSVNTGWTSIATHTSAALTTPPGATLAYKIAGVGESATQTPFTGGTPSAVGGVAIINLSNPSGAAYAAYSPTSQIVDNTYVAPGTAFPVNATPSVTPGGGASLILAFGGWTSAAAPTTASALSISSGWGNIVTSFVSGAANGVSMLSATINSSGAGTISPTIQFTAGGAYGLGGAVIVFNHP